MRGDGRIDELKVHYVSTMAVTDLRTLYRTTIDSAFAPLGHGVEPGAARRGAVNSMARETVYSSPGEFADADRDGLRKLLGGQRLPAVLKQMSRAIVSQSSDDVVDARFKLSALFRLEPAQVREVPRAEMSQPVLAAMGEAGTVESQHALVEVERDKRAPASTRQSALEAMHGLANLDPEVVDAVDQLRRDDDPGVRKSASYAYGSLVGALNGSDPDGASDRIHKLMAEFDAAASDDERVLILETLGNAASAEALPTFNKAVAWPSASVRAAAAKSMRLVPDPSVDGMLTQLMTSDGVADVRKSSVFAVGYRQFAPLAMGLVAVCKLDKVASVRSQALAVLSTFVSRDHEAGAQALIDWVATHDPDEHVRSQAQSAVARN